MPGAIAAKASGAVLTRRRAAVGRLRLVVAASAVVGLLTSCDTARPQPQRGAIRPAATTTTSTPPSVPPTTGCSNAAVLSTWPVARRAAQLVVVPAEETTVQSALPAVSQGAGGVILFGSAAPPDISHQLAGLKAQAPGGIAPLVMTDEEGGQVQRMPNLVGPFSSPRTLATSLDPDAVRQLGERAGHQLLANGVDVDLAPVLDLASGPGPDASHTDGPRSFSPDPAVATTYGLDFARGLLAAGVLPVVKHFPGEGQATANTDDAPAATPALPALEQSDLVPFREAVHARLPAVMVGNAAVPGLTTDPASLSPAAIGELLGGQLGFGGLVVTDSLSAGAIRSSGLDVPHAAVRAVAAGADLVMYDLAASPTDFARVVTQLVAAVGDGTIPMPRLDDAAGRVLAAKGAHLC